MSLLDKASLIVTPNSYKESKLYSIVPNTTLGDMDVVRATTATRVNSAGLIEVVPRNLASYSEDFTNVIWPKLECSITSNSTNSPTGTLTADSLIENSANGRHMIYRSFASVVGTTYTLSLFCKQGTRRYININFKTSTTASPRFSALFDLQTGTNVSTSSVGSPTGTSFGIVSLSDGWYRINISMNSTTTSTEYEIAPSNSATPTLSEGTPTYLGNGTGSVFIWGAQLEEGTTATEYFPTTTRLNIPRIDYTNGSCPSLLVEPQRTNLLTYSNDYSNVSWVKQELTLTANSIISPDGTLNAYKLTPTTVNSPHQLNKLSISAAVSNTMSFYAKKGGYDLVECLDGASGFNGSKFNLNTGTFTNQGTGVGSMVFVGNGWYRCIVTVVTTGIRFYVNNSSSYIGDGTSGIYLWGTQYETASYATSYIPTVASTVTRNADVISKTGISSLIGQTEGTLFCDVNLNSRVSFTYFTIADNLASATNYLGIAFLNNAIAFESVVSGALQANISHSNTSTGRFKIAAAYKANDFVLYINGTQIGVDTSGTIPTCSQIGLSAFNQAQALNYNSAQLYKTRLTNTELAQLTTL